MSVLIRLDFILSLEAPGYYQEGLDVVQFPFMTSNGTEKSPQQFCLVEIFLTSKGQEGRVTGVGKRFGLNSNP